MVSLHRLITTPTDVKDEVNPPSRGQNVGLQTETGQHGEMILCDKKISIHVFKYESHLCTLLKVCVFSEWYYPDWAGIWEM